MIFQVIAIVENHAHWQKHLRYELRLQETPGTISRSDAIGDVIGHIIENLAMI